MIQEIRNQERENHEEPAISSERLEGFAASEMADRGPKAVRMDKRDGDDTAVRAVSALDEDEDFDDDDDMEDDDLALDDVEVDEVDADNVDVAALADDTALEDDDLDDIVLDDDDDEEDDTVL